MGKQKQTPEDLTKIQIIELTREFANWENINENGCQDPFGTDGCNMYLTRNHIIYHKNEIEKICSENNMELPEIYNKETPPEVDMDYMARADEIRLNARKALEIYKANADYKFLVSNVDKLDKKQKEQISIANVIRYASGLESFIEKDSLVEMRRHENPENYLRSFSECAEKVRALMPAEEKYSIPESCLDCTYSPVAGKNTCNTTYVDQVASGKCGWYSNPKTGEMGDSLYKEQYGDGKSEEVEEVKEEECLKIAGKEEVITNVITFDYSTVDKETGAFLQEKANRITEIRIKSVIAMGKELKEAQDKLADHDKTKGTFQKWVGSIGITPRTAYNYINGFDYVVKNFHDIEDADNIQPSLLFAASKPSAPKELSDKVVSGDITTHKQYKELEQKLKDAEFHYDTISKSYKRLEKVNTEHYEGKVRAENRAKQLEAEIAGLKNQLLVAPDASKIKELKATIVELEQQLHDKPIEVPATKVVEREIIPDEVALAIYDKVVKLYEGITRLTEKEIQVFAEQVEPDYYDDLSSVINDAILALENIQSAAYDATTNTVEPEGHCGDCAHANMDGVTEEQLEDGKTLCTETNQIVDFEHSCSKYERYGG